MHIDGNLVVGGCGEWGGDVVGAQDVLETVGCCGGVEESLWGSTETMSHWHRLETALTQVATEEGDASAACLIAAI